MNPSTKPLKEPIFALLLIWVTYLCLLALLQLSGLSVGFDVWPMGEDRAWLGYILDAPGVKMVREFWNQDGRNPLSAWWWLVVSPLIQTTDWGLYAVRKCVDPFLAIITFLLLDRLGRRQCRMFAFCVALIVLMWNFSAYYEQILWDFLIALGLNLAAILFYCRYVDAERHTPRDLAFAMLCYLIAIATYTLQAGAIIAIALLAFFRVTKHKQNLQTRIVNTLCDTGFFAALFIIYSCIWYTVNGHGGAFIHPTWTIFITQFVTSIQEFFFHSAYQALLHLIWTDWSWWTSTYIVVTAFLTFCFIFFTFPAPKILGFNSNIPIGWVVVILMAIATPIVALESVSVTYYPGTRSLMMQQVWQPLLYVSLIFICVRLLPMKNEQYKRTAIFIFVALLGAITVLAGLDYNYRLVIRTQYQKALAKGLEALPLPTQSPTYFLVKLTHPYDLDLNTIPPNVVHYGRTMLHRQDKTIRMLSTQTYPNSLLIPFWKVVFGTDDQGVLNASPIDYRDARDKINPKFIAYKNVWIVFFDGKKVWLPEVVDKNDFAGFEVDWQRKTPIRQRVRLMS